MMDETETLAAAIDAWHKSGLADRGDVPDFWDECDTSERLAEWLVAHGWRRAAEVAP